MAPAPSHKTAIYFIQGVSMITEHQGSKYLRTIRSAINNKSTLEIDVYAIIEAFNVTCPARQHAIKKLLCAGLRDKGSELDDLIGAEAAIERAIELQSIRENIK